MGNLFVTNRKTQRLVLFSVSFGSFMVNVDTYIVNISLPTITTYFHATPQEVAWVSLAYNLTVASLLLIIGKLGDQLGLKRIFILGFSLFTFSSLLCGVSPSLGWLVFSRCIQGVGASMLYAMTPAMIPKFFPQDRRGPAFGALATVTALGMTVGAPLGGLITGWFTWHWIFLINVPVGIMAVWLSRRIIPDDSVPISKVPREKFDYLGGLLSLVGSVAFIYALNMGRELGWLSPAILGYFLLAVAAISCFIYWEGHTCYALIDLGLFRCKAFSYGNLASGLAYAFLAGNNFLMPFYLMTVKGLDSQKAGLTFMVYSLVYMVVGPVAGRLANTISPRLLCTYAMVIGAASAFGFSQVLAWPGLTPVIIYLVFFAITYGAFCTSNNNVIMSNAPSGKQGVAAGVFRMIMRLGMAVGVCAFETVFSLTTLGSGPAGKTAYQALSPETLSGGFCHAYLVGGAFCLLTMAASWYAGLQPREIREK